MTNTNDFKAFAVGGGANVLDQATFAALTTLIANGFSAGIADSRQLNKVWRQSSAMSSAIGAFLNAYGYDALDDGNITGLRDNIIAALTALIQTASPKTTVYCGTSTGSANAQVLTPSPAIAAYGVGTPAYVFLAGYTNTTALFVNISGVGSVEVRKDGESGLVPLTGGEVHATAMCLLRYDGTYMRLEDSQLGTAALQNSTLGTPGGTVASVTGSFTAGHLLVAADSNGTVRDGGPAATLGTAASKAASDNTKSTVSSVSSAATNHITKFTDNNGTVGDGGVLGGCANEGIGQGLEDDGAGNLRVKLDGDTLSRGASGIKETYPNHGQCYLSLSGGNLKLSPVNGNRLIINSVPYSIPDAGITLAPPAVASTTYFIYAYMNSGTMTLEYSTTGHSTQAGTGVEIKTGDATRTLVGMARTTASNAWADGSGQMFVLSWFNRKFKKIESAAGHSYSATTSSTTPVELNGTSGRLEFIAWADEACVLLATHDVSMPAAGALAYTALEIDGGGVWESIKAGLTGAYSAMALQGSKYVTEGYHYLSVYGWVAAYSMTVDDAWASVTTRG